MSSPRILLKLVLDRDRFELILKLNETTTGGIYELDLPILLLIVAMAS